MTVFGGSPIEVENLNNAQRDMIGGVLASMHGEWILHGDLPWENILVEDWHDGPSITFTDSRLPRNVRAAMARWQRLGG
jgi:tRNA A-37 threonylcarbamoyl transferase component Bud32